MIDQTCPEHPPGGSRNAVCAAAAIAGFLALVAPVGLILAGHNSGRAAWDSTVYHEVFIRQLGDSWPRFDLSNPLTATTPGYHIVLGTFDALGLRSTAALRLVSALIGAGLSALLAGWIARRSGARKAVLLSLPLCASFYVLGSSAWLLPDNLAWIGVLLILILCTHEPGSWKPLIAASVVLVGLVFTRQIHIWAAAVVWLGAWLGTRSTDPGLFSNAPKRLGRALVAFVMTLPAFLVVGWFYQHWGGPTPPRFQTDITGVNPATPAFILVQFAILWLGFSPWLLRGTLDVARSRPQVLVIAVVIGLLLVLGPETTQNQAAGRYTGWWVLAQKSPVLMGRTSLAFLVLGPFGAVALAGALWLVPHRPRWVILGALVAFAAAQSSTINSWQRYHEPLLLMLLAMLCALQPQARLGLLGRLRIPCILVLTGVLGLIALSGLRGKPVPPGSTPPPNNSSPGDPWYEPDPQVEAVSLFAPR